MNNYALAYTRGRFSPIFSSLLLFSTPWRVLCSKSPRPFSSPLTFFLLLLLMSFPLICMMTMIFFIPSFLFVWNGLAWEGGRGEREWEEKYRKSLMNGIVRKARRGLKTLGLRWLLLKKASEASALICILKFSCSPFEQSKTERMYTLGERRRKIII